ncbi:MAG: hypothetical protein IJ334_11880 [Clostridia bacterium]|nr:hypothetical protein [Clostridia bacterium]
MEEQQYILIESNYTVNGIGYTTYGIALADITDGCAVIIEAIPDLSPDRERTSRLAGLCTELHLSPLHLADVVDDFLAE